MIFKAFSRASLILLLVVGAPAALAQTREASSSGVLLDRVAATVNEGVVLSSELDEQMFAISERLRSQNLDLPPRTSFASRCSTGWCCRNCRCSARIAPASRCRMKP